MALWTNCHADSGIQHLKMIWTLPAVPPLQVTYMVSPQDAWVLWDSLRNSQKHSENAGEGLEEDNIDIEEVKRFVQALKNHFYRHFRLDLSAGSLTQVSTALGSAKFNGRIKVPSVMHRTKYFQLLLLFKSRIKLIRKDLDYNVLNNVIEIHGCTFIFNNLSAVFFLSHQISNSRYMITTLMLLTECALLKMPIWLPCLGLFFTAKNIIFIL